MQLSDTFNDHHAATKYRDSILKVSYASMYFYYDFDLRLLTIRGDTSSQSPVIMPFAQLDREVLVTLRDKLVELGGTPPELPPETPANPGAKPRALNP